MVTRLRPDGNVDGKMKSYYDVVMNIYKLNNEIQQYAWGSATALPELLKIDNPEHAPMAELWMGTHHKAPSKVVTDAGEETLDRLIAAQPESILGNKTSSQFGGKLPFLFKVIAAAKPLSIQAHPNLDQAKRGFVRENKKGIPLDAPERNYRDDNHKPEIICAVKPYLAMRGFRNVDDIIAEFSGYDIPEFNEMAKELKTEPDSEGLKTFFRKLMELDRDYCTALTAQVLKQVEGSSLLRYRVMRKLQKYYPGDIGVLCPLFLNVLELQPGQAMFLPPGELHAYIEGTGIELMANSDNVLRGGLTSKHMDIPELIHVLTFSEGPPELIKPRQGGKTEIVYPTPIKDFGLAKITTTHDTPYENSRQKSIELLICLEGSGKVTAKQNGDRLEFNQGESFAVSAAAGGYTITGEAVLYRAYVPV